ncbi:MAG: glycosyltransferase family 2 protein [Syntrophomonadaceae bacterium]|jgi:glycosyltransferase involved in cell wall biosynthesis|nr:glycosyltransferase family 2 protein [Syntrophomonadaceae bacterium]
MKLISIVTPCYNEEENVEQLYRAVKEVFSELPRYRYEHIFIDNASRDRTASILRRIASQDPNVKVILNTRNFGHIRSPYHAFLQAQGDAVVGMACDFQDPPQLVKEFIARWEEGFKVVIAVKTKSEESPVMFAIRRLYYSLANRLADIALVKNFTGYGLYDRQVVEVLRKIDDPYPYFRGLIADIGFEPAVVEFTQPTRRRGISKNNFYTLYDIAMLGITNHSKVPLRMAIWCGCGIALVSLAVAAYYLVRKLLYWDTFSLGMAPLVIGMFFLAAIQLLFIGIVGEYIGAIHTQVLKRPLVVEKERINF